jgi:hypothetical protein
LSRPAANRFKQKKDFDWELAKRDAILGPLDKYGVNIEDENVLDSFGLNLNLKEGSALVKKGCWFQRCCCNDSLVIVYFCRF